MMNPLLDSENFNFWKEHCTLKDSTKRGYISQLKKFDRFLVEKGISGEVNFDRFYYYNDTGEFGPIDTEFIDEYVQKLKDNGASQHSLYAAICALTSYFCFQQDMERIEANPMRYFPNPYYDDNFKDRALSKEDVETILFTAYKMDPFYKKIYTMILLMVCCGLRAKELIELRRSCIILERDIILINKGQKTSANSVYILSPLKKAFLDYFNHPHWEDWNHGLDKEVFFFNDQPLTYKTLGDILDAVMKKAGLHYSVTPHQFRHTMAHMMMDQGFPIPVIQRQLRHERLKTTLRYLPKTLQWREFI